MSNYTPGPWDVEGPEEDPFHHCICTIGNGYAVVSTKANPDSYHEGADARLIAAAPELLEALEAALLLVDMSTSIRRKDIAQQSRDAIAKAKGEQG